MSSITHCSSCGVGVPDGVAACPACGAVFHHVMNADPGVYHITGFAPTIIIDGTDAQTGDTVIKVNEPTVYSEARLSPSGRVTLLVQGTGSIGRAGEAPVADTLSEKLRTLGLQVTFSMGVDSRGEDLILRASASTLVAQMVTAPSVPEFWRDASVGSATTSVDLPRALDWMHQAIASKAADMPPKQRSMTVLVVDARHASVIATEQVTNGYIGEHGDPAQEFGFASVWIVGSTVRQTARLGTGVP